MPVLLDFGVHRVLPAGHHPGQCPETKRLGEQRLHHIAVHIREAEVAPAVPVCQAGVVDAQQVQHARVQVVDMHLVLDPITSLHAPIEPAKPAYFFFNAGASTS